METAAASELHLTETNQEHRRMCYNHREGPRQATGEGTPRTVSHSTRTSCKLPDQTQIQEIVAEHASSLELMLPFS